MKILTIRLQTIVLIGILLLAAFLRLYKLAEYPNGFNADEAAIGYNAYSLIQTGKDEHGNSWPVTFTSFADYKAPLYFYIVLPFVATMGLTETAVRLPSALFGIATVLIMYFLVRKITQNEFAALFSSLLLAIAPWHLHFSRGGWEVNVATFFITFGVYSFLKALERPWWFYMSFLSLLAAMYTYQSPKIIVPLLGFGLLLGYWRQLWQVRRQLLTPIIVGILVGLPLAVTMFSKSGTARFSGVSIFADTGPYWAVNELRGEHASPTSLPAKVFHNKVVTYGLDFVKNYTDHFTPAFLFFTGDPIQRNNVPEMGQLYVFEAILFVVGLFFLSRTRVRHRRIIILWLLVAPAAAAITFQTPHALRSANMVIPMTIITGFGAAMAFESFVSRRLLYWATLVIFVLLAAINFAKYLHQYYVHIPIALPFANNYGFDTLVPFVEKEKDKYQKIIVTDRYDQPYILFLFYSKKDPAEFQRQVVLTARDKFGFSTVRQYDTYEFRAVTKDDLLHLRNTLIIGTDEEIPDSDKRLIKTIYFKNGKPAFQIIKT